MKNLSKNNNGNIDTLVFDFDGTLVDTNDIVLGSWQNAARRLYGREFSLDELKATLGEPIMHTVEYLFPEKDPKAVVEAYREFHNENYEDMIRIFPGVPEMLDTLKTSGYKIGLVTNRLRHTTEI
jgi:pyrophosphatase PpaX